MPAAPTHLAAIEAVAERSDPLFTVIQAVHFTLKAECPTALEYRCVNDNKHEQAFTNIAVWASESAPTTFGEPGDLWVDVRTFKMSVCREDHVWADDPADGDHIFATIHPIFPDLALTFNITSIQWYRKTARNSARRELRALLPCSPPQPVVLAACCCSIQSHLSCTPSAQDPNVYTPPPPSNRLQISKPYQLFRSPAEFRNILPPLASSSSPTEVEETFGNRDTELRADCGGLEVAMLYTLHDLREFQPVVHQIILTLLPFRLTHCTHLWYS